MKKLTDKQVEARIEMYEECIEHLNLDVTEDREEMKQAKIVQRQIRAIANRFYDKHKVV